MMDSGRRRRRSSSLRIYILLAVYLLVVSFPFYYMALTSLRTTKDVYNREQMLTPSNLTLSNYEQVFGNTRMMIWLQNSTLVALVSTALSVSISVLAAYALARL